MRRGLPAVSDRTLLAAYQRVLGEIGELWVRPQDPRLVMRGYHNLPDKTAELPKTPTQKVHKHLLRDRGVGPDVWDREAAGIVLRRAAQ